MERLIIIIIISSGVVENRFNGDEFVIKKQSSI